MLPRTAQELEELKKEFADLTVSQQPDGRIHVEITGFKLPDGWSPNPTTIFFIIPQGYPQAVPTEFFAEPSVRGPAGRNPNYTSQQQVDGKTWTRFCWRPQQWDMSSETIWNYVKFIQRAFWESL